MSVPFVADLAMGKMFKDSLALPSYDASESKDSTPHNVRVH